MKERFGDQIRQSVESVLQELGVSSVKIDGTTVSQAWADDGSRHYTFTVVDEDIQIDIELESLGQTYTFTFDTTGWPTDYELSVKVKRNGWQILSEDEYFGETGEVFSIDLWAMKSSLVALYANGEELHIGADGYTYSLTLGSENVVITAEWA